MTAARWGIVVLVVTAAIEYATPSSIVFLSFLGLAPLISAFDGPPRNTVALWVAGVVLALGSYVIHRSDVTAWHAIGTVMTFLVGLMAWRLAVYRSRREERLRESRPHVERSLRLLMAMSASDMGEWWLDVASGRAHWDAGVARLFGIEAGISEGDVSILTRSIHPLDRQEIDDLVESTVASAVGFRRDHRVKFEDGADHWVEVVVEPVIDNGTVTGLVGIVQSTDQRHAEIEERERLIAVETEARHRAEFLDRVYEVFIRSLEVEEILTGITSLAVPELADWAVVGFTMQRPRRGPFVTLRHVDHERELMLCRVLDAEHGAVLRSLNEVVDGWRSSDQSHRSIVWCSTDDAAIDDPFVRWAARFDITSVITLPLVSSLGVHGVLQLVRERGRAHPSVADVDLAEELTSRVGAVLNAAVLYERLEAGREHLQTLQMVTGELAAAATLGDVISAVLAEGRRAIGAEGAALYLIDRSGDLRPVANEGMRPTADLRRYAERAVSDGWVVHGAVEGRDLLVAAIPLESSAGMIGALQFIFPDGRFVTHDELALLDDLGSRTAVAIERASTHDRDHDVALVLQRRLLPESLQSPPWLRVAVRYEPATGGPIGGDWYQMVDLGDRRVAVVVGDAVGHGLVSAAAMGQLRASVATALSATRDPAIALTIVDRFAMLSADTTGASLGLALIDANGTVQYSSAGHPPLVLAEASGSISMLGGGRRPLLGFGGASPPSAGLVRFDVDDTLVLYSDGLIETRQRSFDSGLAELRSVLADTVHLDVELIASELLGRMTAGADTEDDVAVMVVRRVADD